VEKGVFTEYASPLNIHYFFVDHFDVAYLVNHWEFFVDGALACF
jgi:hypothetical protein